MSETVSKQKALENLQKMLIIFGICLKSNAVFYV